MSDRPVIIVHGLWNQGPEAWLLKRRLRRRLRRDVSVFRYPSVKGHFEDSARRLADRIQNEGPVDVIGYSFGGLVTLEAVRRSAPGQVGRVVLISAPVRGSATARNLLGRPPAGRWIIGRSAELLVRGMADQLPEGVDIGVIAGTGGVGMGRVLGAMSGDHDGTVAVRETLLHGHEDRLVLPVTHTGMLFSRDVVKALAAYLDSGRFPNKCRDDAGGVRST
jgi:pimeloyl-ACP methyl ester carboxylesterase